MTNYEKIKNMSVEKMAEELDYIINNDIAECTNSCYVCPATKFCKKFATCEGSIKKWLESEADE